MAYRHTPKLDFPLKGYAVDALDFGERGVYAGTDWGVHLGEDVLRRGGTKVYSAGRGKVVYSELHPGSKEKGNWGNVIIIAHKNPKNGKAFFSLYGHLGERFKEKGDRVEIREAIGVVGKANTPENGWWDEEHLHFSIYTGPWEGKVLPGYFKSGQKRTKLSFWKDPSNYIRKYGD
ncbi:MAG: hypothetical protein UY41_C0018G0010 [Candidatus Moranbacteria bacterium GW2011_GWE1_49_15]|nr:MAG: hypothetical protein UX75_C0046G0005 [Candidatus Moranbacteria bacterium GW2011_GWE2_47_10]KKW06652.1 MAG: hypothetical protein UY41_C0018G0010 [Candidatus Moranbacteria bacterium GW2011_GWE1_49_15]HBP00705.1 hypothetical protein [Candidatus Moranbacteria bacterium]